MEIRLADLSDKQEIIDLYIKSQEATGIPNPEIVPADMLGELLYCRNALARYVAKVDGMIVGHGLNEPPNPLQVPVWKSALKTSQMSTPMIQLGGAFVHPDFARQGIWSEITSLRLSEARALGAIPVSATWEQNTHVRRKFEEFGGREIEIQDIPEGRIALFVFD